MTKQEVIEKIVNGEIKIINCTPHAITWMREEEIVFIEPSGIVARVNIEEADLGHGFVTHLPGEIIDLPEPQEGKVFLVSGFVFAGTNRGDVIAPNTNKSIRDENGKIIGVPGFIMQF